MAHYSSKDEEDPELFFWPWRGIIANIPVQWRDGRYIGESGTQLRDRLRAEGFNAVKVSPLWSRGGHSTYALVEFSKDWSGFENAVRFEKHYDINRYGKRDYFSRRQKENHLYGWIAQSDDYYSDGVVGKQLRKTGDLKSIAEVEEEDKRKTGKLVTSLANAIEAKNMRLKEIETKYVEIQTTEHRVMAEKDEMHRIYNEEIKKMQQNARGQLENILKEHHKIKLHLERERFELEEKAKTLEKREAQNENERLKIYSEKQMNERAALEQKKSDVKILSLAEEQKREKESLHMKIIELEKKIDAKQALELEIERLRGAVQVRNLMREGEDEYKDEAETKRLIEIKENLKEKEEELEGLEEINNALIVKQRNANDELQEARKELIKEMMKEQQQKKRNFKRKVGVKRMGELDEELFGVAIKKRKVKDGLGDEESALLLSQWDENIRDSNWYPFKVVKDESNDGHKLVIDENDVKLKNVKNDVGIEAYEAVTIALSEMNEYNSSGRYPQPELWNFEDNRRATLQEGISRIITQWKNLKKKK